MGILENARPENSFYCADGSVLKNLHELEQKLRTISSEAYAHHVSQSKNDFHNWIRDIFRDNELAASILKAKTAAEAAAAVRRRLARELAARQEIEQAIAQAQRKRANAPAPASSKKARHRPKPKRQKKAPKRRKLHKKKTSKKGVKRAAEKTHTGNRGSSMTFLPNQKAKKKTNHKTRRSLKRHGASSGSDNKQRKQRHNRKGKAKKSNARNRIINPHVKKQVNRWLNWLKIFPEQ